MVKRASMTFAYADPPYLGCGKSHYGKHHEAAADYDDPETHRRLIERLADEFPDGWALSLHEPSLRVLLPMCPDDCRTSAWVKPFAAFKPGVGVAYAWEPIIWRGGRKRTREQPTIRDWHSANITMQRGLPGAKPTSFAHWVLDLMNAQPGDTVVDLFPGSGAVSEVIRARLDRVSEPEVGMFA